MLPLSLITIALAADSACGPARREPAVRGRYANSDYAYAADLPPGLVGFRSAPPSPNHGFGVDLCRRADAYLWVDASYNALDDPSPDSTLRAHAGWLRDEGARRVALAGRAATRLAGLPARQAVLRYVDSAGRRMVEDVTVAFRGDIVYTVGLRSPEARYPADSATAAAVRRRVQRRPLPRP